MLRSLVLLFVFLMSGCQSAPKTDYDPNADFVGLKSFVLLSPDDTKDPLSSERIRTAILQTLLAKSFVQSDQPDFKVNWAFQTGSKPSGSGLSIGLGTGSWGRTGGIGVGTRVGVPLGGEVHYQQIQIDVLSAADNRLIWRGSDGFEFREGGEDKAAATLKAVARILAQFPPK